MKEKKTVDPLLNKHDLYKFLINDRNNNLNSEETEKEKAIKKVKSIANHKHGK